MKKFVFPGVLFLFFALTTALQAGGSNFSGEWDSFWGDKGSKTKLTLVQNGNKVSGVYSHKTGSLSGVIDKEGWLHGSWSQREDGKSGTFKFKIAADGGSFHGKWRYGSKGDWKGDWNGVRR